MAQPIAATFSYLLSHQGTSSGKSPQKGTRPTPPDQATPRARTPVLVSLTGPEDVAA